MKYLNSYLAIFTYTFFKIGTHVLTNVNLYFSNRYKTVSYCCGYLYLRPKSK